MRGLSPFELWRASSLGSRSAFFGAVHTQRSQFSVRQVENLTHHGTCGFRRAEECLLVNLRRRRFLIMRRHTLYRVLQSRPVQVFETSGVAFPARRWIPRLGQIDAVCFAINLSIIAPLITIANSRPSDPFLLLSALSYESFPAGPRDETCHWKSDRPSIPGNL